MGEGCGWEAGGCANAGVQASMVCTNADTTGGVAEKQGMNEGVCTQADGGWKVQACAGTGSLHKCRNRGGKQLGRGGVCTKAGGGWEVRAWACMNGGAAKVDTVGGLGSGGMHWHPERARAFARGITG
jgi:hypothetical protein